MYGAAQVVFIASESDIKHDAFADCINQILKTGEIGGLYTRDEFEAVCTEVTPIMQRAGVHSFCFVLWLSTSCMTNCRRDIAESDVALL